MHLDFGLRPFLRNNLHGIPINFHFIVQWITTDTEPDIFYFIFFSKIIHRYLITFVKEICWSVFKV